MVMMWQSAVWWIMQLGGLNLQKILIIEDDVTISRLMESILGKAGYDTESAFTGQDGISMALQEDYSLILMDLMLPGKTGEDIIRELRKTKSTLVIILSAKSETHNRIELFRLGADDYITKPFDVDEVTLRIRAVLRRTSSDESKEVAIGEILINTGSKRVFISGNEIYFTVTEYTILELLALNPQKIFSKRNLFESVTGEEYLSEDNTMNVHISNLRKKIAQYTEKKYIETVYGMGYRLSV